MKKYVVTVLLALIMSLSLMTAGAMAVDTETRDSAGYEGETLPAGPEISGDIWTVTPENAQYTLDGAYGSIDGKTIHFSSGTYGDLLVLGRTNKFTGSGTKYYTGNWSGEVEFADVPDSGTHHYSRSVKNVTFTADDGVVLPGFTASSGHIYGKTGAPVFDYVRLTSTESSVNSYYAAVQLEDIRFVGLTISGGVTINDYLDISETSGISFTDCTFTGSKASMATNDFTGIVLKADNKSFDNISVSDCSFTDYYQGIYVQGPNGITVERCSFNGTTHNAIAIQSSTANSVQGSVIVEENLIRGAGDRAIRFGNIAADASITVENNVILDSGDDAGELIKPGNIDSGASVSLEHNYWAGEDVSAAVVGFDVPNSTGVISGTFPIDVAECAGAGYTAAETASGEFEVLPMTEDIAPAAVVSGGGTEYFNSLTSAVMAAEEGDRIVLLRDYDWPFAIDSCHVLNIAGVTFDLNGYTVTAAKLSLVFEGSGLVVRNGSFICDSGHYALFIGDEGETQGALVEEITTYGGLNIYNASGVVLREVDAVGTKYYAVWADENAFISIESGTYRTNGAAVMGTATVSEGVDASIEVKGGEFNSLGKKLVLEDEETRGEVLISGGYFTEDPTTYLAPGKVAVAESRVLGGVTYSYTVGDRDTAIDVDTAVSAGQPDVSVPQDSTVTSQAVKAAAGSENTNSDLVYAARNVSNDAGVVGSLDAAAAELEKAGIETEGRTVTVVIEPYLSISVATSDHLIYDIKALYNVKATTNPDAMVESGEGRNTVPLKTAQNLDVSSPVRLELPVPSDFTASPAYVKHTKGDGAVYYYKGTLSDGVISFTNPNGFSKFEILTAEDAGVVASVGDVYFDSLDAAIDYVPDRGTITLLTGGLSATVTRTVTFTIAGGYDCTLTAGPGYYLADQSGNTYTFKYRSLPGPGTVSPDEDEDTPDVPEPKLPFYDVDVNAWYYDAVCYVYYADLMDGVDTHEFAPEATLTRAMVWTILARMEGVDTTGGATWYAKAQEWATAKGISDGENPNAAITREQFVTMLYRLAGEPAVSGSVTAPDAANVSSWAADAMTWAVNVGLVEGDENGNVNPTANANRAEAAALIMRFIEK